MSKLFRKSARREGFTLIELIVVITILGILIAIAVPRLGAFRAQAVEKQRASNVRIAKGAAAMWLAEHGNPAGDYTFTSADMLEYLESWPLDGVVSVSYTSGNIVVVPTP